MEKENDFIKKIQEKGIRHILFHTLPWKINEKLDMMISFIIKKIFLSKELQDIIIIESHNDFDSNGGAFYEYLIKHGYNKKYKIVWFLRNKCPRNLPLNVKGYQYSKPNIMKSYYYCVAKYIICGHQMIPSIRAGQKSYYTTHGAFSLKAFKGNVTIPDGISYIMTPSEHLNPILADGYMIDYPNNRMISIGFPLHDILYNQEPGDLMKITRRKYTKTILWMPTFRKSVSGRKDSSRVYSLGIPIVDSLKNYRKLNKELAKRNVLLVIKIHPMQEMEDVKITSLSNIKLLDGISVKKLGIDNYRLMKDMDALISDYSSSAYDYLHLNRPIAYTMDDAEDYKVGFLVENPKDYMAGTIIYNYEDLYSFIADVSNDIDDYKEKREELSDKIWEFHDGKSCERLAKHMNI